MKRQTLKTLLAACALLAAATLAQAQDKVVYHFDDAATQALKGLRNIRNHLDTLPQTQIVVVTHANGVDFLMEGAKDAAGKDKKDVTVYATAGSSDSSAICIDTVWCSAS